MKFYDDLLASWQSSLNAMWQGGENELKAKDTVSGYAWLTIGVILFVVIAGFLFSAIYKSGQLAIVFALLSLIDVIAYVLIRFLWDIPLQREICAYKDNLNLNIFETLTREKGISVNAWKLVLDCVLYDCEKQESARKNVSHIAITLLTSMYVGVMAASLWNTAKQIPPSTEGAITILIVFFALMILTCGIAWMAGEMYERVTFFGKRRRTDLNQFASFVEKGLFEHETGA